MYNKLISHNRMKSICHLFSLVVLLEPCLTARHVRDSSCVVKNIFLLASAS